MFINAIWGCGKTHKMRCHTPIYYCLATFIPQDYEADYSPQIYPSSSSSSRLSSYFSPLGMHCVEPAIMLTASKEMMAIWGLLYSFFSIVVFTVFNNLVFI